MFDLSGDSVIISLLWRKQRDFIIFLRCEGPDVAVRASIGTSGRTYLSSPMRENTGLNTSASSFPLPLKKVGIFIRLTEKWWHFLKSNAALNEILHVVITVILVVSTTEHCNWKGMQVGPRYSVQRNGIATRVQPRYQLINLSTSGWEDKSER